MAEERIYITEVKEGDVCPFEEYCEGFSKLCEGCNVLPTRQEAIRKMCDAYFKAKDKGDMESERVVAALNALLEEK